jgi:hypothetical protein
MMGCSVKGFECLAWGVGGKTWAGNVDLGCED